MIRCKSIGCGESGERLEFVVPVHNADIERSSSVHATFEFRNRRHRARELGFVSIFLTKRELFSE
jgi:hypothetical protein